MINLNDKINRSRPGKSPAPDPVRHARRCAICHHPERDAIEEEFVHWFHADRIAEDYELPSRSGVYRHAYATGLYDLRRRNMRYALEHLIEEARLATPVTGDTVIRAVRAHARLTATGRWIEPPKELIVSRRVIPKKSAAPRAAKGQFLTGTPKQLKSPVTNTKQTTEVIPIRDTNTTPAEAN